MGNKKFSMAIAICVHVPAAASLLITELYVPVTLTAQQRRQGSHLAARGARV